MGLQLNWNSKNIQRNWEGIERSFRPGEDLLKDKTGKNIGLLIEGMAKNSLISEDGKERVLSFMTALAIFGEVTAFTGRKFISNLSVQSITPVKVIYITKETLEKTLKNDPEMAMFLLHASSEKVSSLISLVNGSSFQNTLRLIRDVLLNLGSVTGEVKLTHEEMANIIGRNRVTVSKSLMRLQKSGIIEQKKKKIMITDLSALQELS